MNKIVKSFLGLFLIVILLLVGVFYYLTSSPMTKAFLIKENGNVEVDSGSGWKQAVNGMLLSLNDKIRTSAEGKAAIVLYEGVIIQLESGTEVSLTDLTKDNLKITQTIGKTWNKFTKLAGVNKIDIITPNSVATVRGTEFQISTSFDEFEILVVEGNVEVSSGSEKKMVSEFKKYKKNINGFIEQGLTQTDKILMIEKAKNTLEKLRLVRERKINENTIFNAIKEKYELTYSDIQEGLAKIDSGEIDERKYAEKVPISTAVAEKFFAINDIIKEQQKLIQRLKNR